MAKIIEQGPATGSVEDHDVEHVEGETKAEAFTRLAQARTRKALKMISLLGNLGSSQYECTPEQVDKIERALLIEVQQVMKKLRREKQATPSFSL